MGRIADTCNTLPTSWKWANLEEDLPADYDFEFVRRTLGRVKMSGELWRGNMNQKVALRYVVIQFMPYIETGEFANIGIVALSPKIGFFDYRIARKYRRITQFFPKLQGREYRAGVSFFS
ncbi:DUF3037 domain-containing protein [Ignatzschineria cameli]|uniref:Uncharacterized protein n=1 Tax=Ignatzschineria cameli TaxID=2182793 RepID=A0A2U2AR55_9GAMM|nr:DUF3037 domain-containing protein [Ignatzschineria cameli]PWD86343.1 hypothetical protein DC077_06290 [Ignatzschineria cameli]PWD89819.1 hypothetical protein DC079_05640 [Ignatzschineria cameli]PWD91469.1 hypothetical protein DC081_05350 [Ignatzschineria cameli]PWD92507.1 hypothetical protein DC078_05635 [Ignatzschineria cameli]